MEESVRSERALLVIAGSCSLALALLHVVLIFIGPSAYRYFGAGEGMARRAQAGSLMPAAVTLGVATVLCIFGLYALSGAAVVRRLPLLRPALVGIAAIYTLRGLSFFPQVWYLLQHPGQIPMRFVAFSGASLAIGLAHSWALARSWSALSPRRSWLVG
jgi:hypothetical protein